MGMAMIGWFPQCFFMCFMFASSFPVLTMYVLLSLISIRCLSELAKQIGFLNSARNIFSLKDQFFTFRHVSILFIEDKSAWIPSDVIIFPKYVTEFLQNVICQS